MSSTSTEKTLYDELMGSLVDVGTRAFDPNLPATTREPHQREFDGLIQNASTILIIPVLNTLIQPERAPKWLREKFLEALAVVPLRPLGVRATLEFVFAVHPSTEPSDKPGRQGASITHEAMVMASRLLATPPAAVPPEVWFAGIAPQLLELLEGQHGPELTKVAAYVVGFGILGRRQYGAPDTPGWKNLAEPILMDIRPNIGAIAARASGATNTNEIVDLSKDPVLVRSLDLATALRRLQSLVISHPNPGLSRRLLQHLFLPLWSLSLDRGQGPKKDASFLEPARDLLRIYLKVANSLDPVRAIIANLLWDGERKDNETLWIYQVASEGGVEIVAPRQLQCRLISNQIDPHELERRAQALLELLDSTYSDEDISGVFLELFTRWIMPGTKHTGEIGFLTSAVEDGAQDDPVPRLLEGYVLQKMMEKFPDKLASQPAHILKLVDSLLLKADEMRDDDEDISVALSLLNLIATTPNFQKGKVEKNLMQSMEDSLERMSKAGRSEEISKMAGNLVLLLKLREGAQDSDWIASNLTDGRAEDRKTYALAMSYVTQRDSPPPVRSEGLNLLQGLILANSPILDIPAILVLMSSLLVENEDYINLRVIRIYTQLANRHPKAVTKELVDRYVDPNETAAVDTRLRFGEALLQVIERLGETFAGEAAGQVCHALLSTAGRRGYRPKTEAKQARDEKLRKLKAARGDRADRSGSDDDDDDEQEEDGMSALEKADEEILSRIVEGWSSKRGAEDVRIRASALSILAFGIETNVAGVGPDLVSSAVDLSMQVLALETEIEKGILRRSAVLVVLSFVRALDRARQEKRLLGFGLTDESRDNIIRILGYVADTDNDGLVRQHAKDVIESLENWRIGSLLPEVKDLGQPAITRLVGLNLSPSAGGGQSSGRPVIEEIE